VANGAKRVLVIGAGFETEAFLRSIQLEDNPAINPIAILDDNPYKKNMRIGSLPVVGVVEDLEAVIPKFEVDQVLIVDPEISAMSVKEISEKCSEYGVPTYIMPRISEISQDPNGDVLGRPLEVSDLLGRRELNLDEESIRSVIRDKTVLVTGAGGSIGAELCRQIKRLKPGTLLMLDRDESSLHALQLSLVGNGLLTDANIILADIRDATRINEIFEKFSPDIVFHAAALKHLPLLESAPDEAWKTNVVGTKNVLAASKDFDVSIFVNISTDKAADPTSILGLTKRLTERLVCGVGLESSFKYVSVRFGNVLGSRGSMLDAFTYQISQGGPVTVTDPSVSRYFMTIPEASQLVLQAAVLGEQGEVLVLDMGEPVKILDVAEFLIARSGKEIAIEFTGLREGEKLHEVLSGIDENSEIRKHSLISHLRVEPIVNIDEAKFIFENRIY
jgi:FlaA1/EpsC-like NDP-sugar epimerase